jgi:hypothetical protein
VHHQWSGTLSCNWDPEHTHTHTHTHTHPLTQGEVIHVVYQVWWPCSILGKKTVMLQTINATPRSHP